MEATRRYQKPSKIAHGIIWRANGDVISKEGLSIFDGNRDTRMQARQLCVCQGRAKVNDVTVVDIEGHFDARAIARRHKEIARIIPGLGPTGSTTVDWACEEANERAIPQTTCVGFAVQKTSRRHTTGMPRTK